jgi:sulfatase modifying factor 1
VCRIPAGSARLGTDTPALPADGEGPSFAYTQASAFWLDETEVTVSRFAAFVRATGYVSEAHAFGWSFVHELAVPEAARASIASAVRGSEWWLPVPNATWAAPTGLSGGAGDARAPALHVSVRDAVACCGAAGGRLPSEDEWEYAARGGKAGRTYPWGQALLTGARRATHRANIWQGAFPYNNTAEDGHAWAAPAGAFPPQNGWGLRDMIGNAWEWTATPWCAAGAAAAAARKAARAARLPWAPSARPADPPDCAALTPAQRAAQAADAGEIDYVKKGGSFMCHESYCFRYRTAARHKNTANSAAYNLGFRCAYDALPEGAEVVQHAGGAEGAEGGKA